MSIPRQCTALRGIPYFVRCVPIHGSRISCGGWVSIQRKRLRGKINREPKELLRRAEATQRLQGRDRLRSCRVAADAGREPDFSVLRNSELGGAPCGVAAHYRISGGGDSCLGV